MTLNKIRKIINNIFAKICLIIVIISFLIFGLDGFLKSPDTSIASINNKPISSYEFERAKNAEISRIKSMIGQTPSDDFLQSLNLDNVILSRIIDKRLIEDITNSLNLLVSDKIITSHIIKNEHFFKNKEFDEDTFKEVIKLNGMTQKEYINLMKKDIASSAFLDIINKNIIENPIIEKSILKYLSEEVNFRILTISLKKNNYIIEEKEIEDYFKANQDKFTSPEYRSIKYISFSKQDVKSDLIINDDDLKKEYNENLDDYTNFEQRDVYNLFFTKEEDALKARDALLKDSDFEKYSEKNLHKQDDPLILKDLSFNSISPKISEEIFGLTKGAISVPIESELGFHLFKLKSIKPETTQDFETAKEKIREKLTENDKEKLLAELIDEIDDELILGTKLEEIAKRHNLTVKRAEYQDMNGVSPAGKKTNSPELDNFLEIAFATKGNENSNIASSSNNSIYFVTSADDIIKSKVKDLKEVKEEISNFLTIEKEKDETKKLVNNLYDEMKIAKTSDIEKIINKHSNLRLSISISGKQVTTRLQEKQDISLTETLINELFTLKPGQITKPQQNEKNNYIIALLDSFSDQQIITQNLTEKIHEEVKESSKDSIYESLMSYLYKTNKIQRNFTNSRN